MTIIFLVVLQMKKDGLEMLKGSTLGMANLYKKIVRSDIEGIFIFYFFLHTKSTIIIGAHRALPDIMAMEWVLTHPSMVSCLF